MKLPVWPVYSDEEVSAVNEVLHSGRVNYWTGKHGKEFEKEYAAYSGVKFGVAVANGSVGLTAALHALDIGKGDEVIVTPRSFFACASAIELAGAKAKFAEVDRDSQNLTPNSIIASLTPRTKAILCVHLAGWPCDMPGILKIARENKLSIIEDCAQAHGAMIGGKPVGSWGDIGVFSFCQDKIISTGGEGGMLVTDSRNLYEKLWSYKDHGKSYSAVHSKTHLPGFMWLHESFGTNLRMTEMQASIGRLQLKKLDDWVAKRSDNANFLADQLRDIECLRIPMPAENIYHSYYKFYVFVRPALLKKNWNRDRIIKKFSKHGIPGLSGSCPEIYLEKAFNDRNHKRLPVAKELGETSIMFEVHPTLDNEHLKYIAQEASKILLESQIK
ncbi:MAG: DegT/DnrJ/EryC1/StrS aminotransferase family protein [Pseudomonadota bacterium]|nr:DegT/DnrJ/EryC1/StrS aminotransferase family protein [Pseudomonadota bacterium]